MEHASEADISFLPLATLFDYGDKQTLYMFCSLLWPMLEIRQLISARMRCRKHFPSLFCTPLLTKEICYVKQGRSNRTFVSPAPDLIFPMRLGRKYWYKWTEYTSDI
jgi:hypothetical protein